MIDGVEYSEQTQCLCKCYMIDGDEYSEQTQCLCECYTIDGVEYQESRHNVHVNVTYGVLNIRSVYVNVT